MPPRKKTQPWSHAKTAERVRRAWHKTDPGVSPPDGDEESADRVVRLLQEVVAQCASMCEARAIEVSTSGEPGAAQELDAVADAMRRRFGLRR